LFRKIDVSAAKISTLFVPEVDFVLKKLSRRRVGLGRFEAAGIVIFGGVDEGTDGIGGQLGRGEGLEEGGEKFKVLGDAEP